MSSAWDKTAMLERKLVGTGTRKTKRSHIVPRNFLCLFLPVRLLLSSVAVLFSTI